jgi:hypothetical protein
MSGVTVSATRLRKAWRDGPEAVPWLVLRTKDEPDAAFAAAQQAAAAANADAEAAGSPEGPLVLSGGLMTAPKGVLIELHTCDDPAALVRWASVFADTAADAGVSGRLQPGEYELTPITDPRNKVRGLAAAFSLPIDYDAFRHDADTPPRVTTGWYVDDNLTEFLIDYALRWCPIDGGDWYVARDLNQARVDGSQAESMLRTAMGHGPTVSLTCVRGTEAGRHVLFDRRGYVYFERTAGDGPWQPVVDGLLEVMRDVGPRSEHGLLRRVWMLSFGFSAVVGHWAPKPPKVSPGYDGPGRYFGPTHVPDAYGAQTLSPGHLDGGPDLSRWDIEPLPEGRALVTSRDRDAWFADTEPDAAVLAAARADFDPILLSTELISEYHKETRREERLRIKPGAETKDAAAGKGDR